MPYLQHFVGSLLDDAGDSMPVRGPKGERLQNQQVQSALQQLELAVPLSSRHSTEGSPVQVECQGESRTKMSAKSPTHSHP